MSYLDTDLRKYITENHNNLTWKTKIKIIFEIIKALYRIHKEGSVHRDLHSGNILYSREKNDWYISDLGFCGPADKPLGSIYGNLSYIAPEVISGKEYTFASDIYSFAMLIWEILSGQPPFANFNEYSDYELAMNIISGMRPKIGSEVPLKYKELMEQCWDADPTKRPNAEVLRDILGKMHISYYQNENEEQKANNIVIGSNSNTKFGTSSRYINSLVKRFSKIHIFERLSEPRNATEGR